MPHARSLQICDFTNRYHNVDDSSKVVDHTEVCVSVVTHALTSSLPHSLTHSLTRPIGHVCTTNSAQVPHSRLCFVSCFFWWAFASTCRYMPDSLRAILLDADTLERLPHPLTYEEVRLYSAAVHGIRDHPHYVEEHPCGKKGGKKPRPVRACSGSSRCCCCCCCLCWCKSDAGDVSLLPKTKSKFLRCLRKEIIPQHNLTPKLQQLCIVLVLYEGNNYVGNVA